MALENDFEQCRLCLSSVMPEKCIFTTEDDNKISLATKIMVCTSLVVTSNDDKPQYLCLHCEEILESFFEFRNKCLHSHFQLCFDADVITDRKSPSKLFDKIRRLDTENLWRIGNVVKVDIKKHAYNNHAVKWTLKSRDKSKQLLFENSIENATVDAQFENVKVINIKSFDDKFKQSVQCVEEVNFHEDVNDIHFDTSRQFQVGCYLDLEEDVINVGHEESLELHRRFKCTNCLLIFSTLENLDEHWDTCEADKTKTMMPDIQEVEVFNNTEVINENKEGTFSENSLVSFKKNIQFPLTKKLVHRQQNYLTKNREHQCKYCGQVFNKAVLLRKHSRIHANKRLCTLCQKSFKDDYELKYHMRIHSENAAHMCKVCGKKFTKNTALQLHLRIHTGEKPYSCQYCKMTFAQLCHLRAHERTHTGEKPYKCIHCPRTFTQGSTKNKHQKTHVEGTKMFQCVFCDRMFATNDELELHQATHNGEMPWNCELCSQCFNKPSLLKKHIHRYHTEDRPFQCNLCSKAFITCNDLKSHLNTHSEIKRFQCEHCKVFFKQKSTLLKHKYKLHFGSSLEKESL